MGLAAWSLGLWTAAPSASLPLALYTKTLSPVSENGPLVSKPGPENVRPKPSVPESGHGPSWGPSLRIRGPRPPSLAAPASFTPGHSGVRALWAHNQRWGDQSLCPGRWDSGVSVSDAETSAGGAVHPAPGMGRGRPQWAEHGPRKPREAAAAPAARGLPCTWAPGCEEHGSSSPG